MVAASAAEADQLGYVIEVVCGRRQGESGLNKTERRGARSSSPSDQGPLVPPPPWFVNR